jgi:hypothetical protein
MLMDVWSLLKSSVIIFRDAVLRALETIGAAAEANF